MTGMDSLKWLSDAEFVAQIDAFYLFIIEDAGGVTFCQYAAFVDYIGSFTDIQSFTDIMVGDEDTDISGTEIPNNLFNIIDRDRVDPSERLNQAE